MNRTLLASASIALLALAVPASAASIRECNAKHETFAAKRACAGNPGTASTRGMFTPSAPSTPSEPGGENPGGENPGGENPGGENPGGENPGHGGPGHHGGWGHGHGHGGPGKGWGHGPRR